MISINIYEILMQIVNFCILWWLMSKFLIKPLGSFLENRAKVIKQDITVAETNRVESEKLLEQQKDVLNTARQEAKKIRQDAEIVAEKSAQKLLDQAKQDSDKVFQNARKEIEQDVKKVKQELVSETKNLSVMLAKRILKREISPEDQAKIAAEVLEQKV